MPTTFPTTKDNFTNNVDNVDTIIAQDINDLNDAVEALETKVGVDDSAVSTSIDYILKNKIWPVGAVFTAVIATSPATLLGFGTWSQIAGGKVLIGQTDSDADFNVAEETGGSKTATLAIANLAAHDHTGSSIVAEGSHVHTGPSHQHGGTTDATAISEEAGTADLAGSGSTGRRELTRTHTHPFTTNPGGTGNTGTGSAHTHGITVASQGSGTAFSIVNPYLVVYVWKRTA